MKPIESAPFAAPLLNWSLAVAIIAGLGGLCLAPVPARAAGPGVVVKLTDELKFAPASVTVKVGDAVEWRNDSVLVHTVTDDPQKAAKAADSALPEGARPFGSGNLKPGATYKRTFTVPGTYRYFCIPHEAAGMVATVQVTK
ncbi:plastocyanin [Tistlia consotensis]|uniref:Plastocyanin n=1 Tax=Tistlia consotensis USBA 355 TaxID=560819 RepID=A0A1Y6BS19_9PROT|nr:plastocyanin/azurin family copper-binding protein [Tistlia consotensis]SMF26376.1 plastocyanin [Tistlia consotensis USBA 355]SNR67195.1 plastocyanin [Tistlia consotensis]